MHKIEYDPQVKVLRIRLSKARAVDSEVRDNVVLDYGKNGELVNLEVMDVNLEKLMTKAGAGKIFKG